MNCILCGNETNVVVNIHFKMKHVCQSCCNSVMIQNAIWLSENVKVEDLK